MKYKKVSAFSILLLLTFSLTVSFATAISTLAPVPIFGLTPAPITTNDWTDTPFGVAGSIIKYIFGPLPNVTSDGMSNAIIAIAVWLLILITFGDILASFSSFSKVIGWIIATLLTIIAANLNFLTIGLSYFIGIFLGLGVAAVYLGLAAAFVAFALVNLGVWSARNWVIRRRAMMAAANTKAGATEVAATVSGLGKIGKAMEKIK